MFCAAARGVVSQPARTFRRPHARICDCARAHTRDAARFSRTPLCPAPAWPHVQAGEALGAIADPESLPVLERLSSDERPEVAETCQIARDRVRWVMEHGEGAEADGHLKDNPYESVDPAPATKKPSKDEIPLFQAQLMDASLPLFERYRAMFSLRNNRSRAAVLVRFAGVRERKCAAT